MMEKLFDEKISHLNGKLDGQMTLVNNKLDALTVEIVGNGKRGLRARVLDLETFNVRLLTAYSVVVSFLVIGGIYIRGFIEAIWKHIYLTGRG